MSMSYEYYEFSDLRLRNTIKQKDEEQYWTKEYEVSTTGWSDVRAAIADAYSECETFSIEECMTKIDVINDRYSRGIKMACKEKTYRLMAMYGVR